MATRTRTPRSKLLRDAPKLETGWLIIPNIRIQGCVQYSISARKERVKADALKGEWRTDKTVQSLTEHRGVYRACDRIIGMVSKLGYKGTAGIFVPHSRMEDLEEAVQSANNEIEKWNSEHSLTSLNGEFVVFAVSGDNAGAARLIWERATASLTALTQAIENTDVAAIRKALHKAKRLEHMFPEKTSAILAETFVNARKLATALNKKSADKSEVLKRFQDQIETATTARIMFTEATEQVNTNKGRSKDKFSLPPIDMGTVELEPSVISSGASSSKRRSTNLELPS